MNHSKEEDQYILSMSEKERKAYEVAKKHLGSLFTLHKTAGFIQWKKKQESNTTHLLK
jgi:hypothetical protein